MLGLSCDFNGGDHLRDRLGNGDYDLLRDAKSEGGLEELLNLRDMIADLEAEIKALKAKLDKPRDNVYSVSYNSGARNYDVSNRGHHHAHQSGNGLTIVGGNGAG